MTEPLPIPASAIEAAENVLLVHADQSGEGWQNWVEEALRAAFEELGMEEKRRPAVRSLKGSKHAGEPDQRCFYSRWMPVEEP